jgi:hypothetical protein
MSFPQRHVSRIYVFIDSEVNFTSSFYNNYNFSVAQKMLSTWAAKSFEHSRDCPVLAASGLGDNFSFGTLKNDFAALIYK